MKYAFTTPAGWSRSPFPPPQRGVYLRAPVSTPSPEAASILLFDAVAPSGTMEEHLGELVKQSCEGLKMGKSGKVQPVKTVGYRGLTVALTVQVTPAGQRARDEVRIYYLIDAGSERLPVTFVGGAKSLPKFQAALDALVASIGPLVLAPDLYTRWVE